MMQNLQIIGLCFLSISIMFYLLIDIFEKSKRLRQPAPTLQEISVETVKPPSVQEGVYPMYIDCSRSPRIVPQQASSTMTPAAV